VTRVTDRSHHRATSKLAWECRAPLAVVDSGERIGGNLGVVIERRGGDMENVEVGGLRVAFQRRGDGPCLLLLHGAVSDSRVWRVELDSLSDVFTVVAWDAPGCGGSSDPPEHFRLAEYAE
jgi:alpha/beta hydrolase family protein